MSVNFKLVDIIIVILKVLVRRFLFFIRFVSLVVLYK